jgi:hypothetical protein
MPLINNDRGGRRTVRAGHIAAAVGILAALAAAALLITAIALRS